MWIWQGFNIRLLAIPHGEDGRHGYDHGWCYPRDPQLVAASVATWDPTTQDEPTGWHKRPTHPARQAPHREKDPSTTGPAAPTARTSTKGATPSTAPTPDTARLLDRTGSPACRTHHVLTKYGDMNHGTVHERDARLRLKPGRRGGVAPPRPR
ncbi:hypothetical protein NKH18_01380 [Streptomyces sp. M10(2022)]